MKVHTTIGVYRDESFKTNGVNSANLKNHIEYNENWRFGRALLVDGEIQYLGYFSREDLERVIKEKKLNEIVVDKDTAPYQ